MSDNTANEPAASAGPVTVADILRGVAPMGDLRRFAIEDLTPAEEDEFFHILEDV